MAQQEADLQNFFIPDLCAPWPAFVLVLLAQLMVFVYVLAVSALPEFDWELLSLSSLLVQWVVLLSAVCLCSLRSTLARLSLMPGVIVCYAVILGVALVVSLVAQYYLVPSQFPDPDGWWLARNMLLTLVLGGVVLRFFYLQQLLSQREQAELRARLESLRARIRPHFLFNTMNSIASLIATKPDEAERVIEDLCELFRASLAEGEQLATVADELRLCRLYLRIEQLRLGDRLQVDWQVQEDLSGESMAVLILQPLVENAIYHGVAQLAEGGGVVIRLHREQGSIVIEIENPVPGTPGSEHVGHHMAQRNVRERLAALYGEKGAFESIRDGNRHRVLMSYPLLEEVS